MSVVSAAAAVAVALSCGSNIDLRGWGAGGSGAIATYRASLPVCEGSRRW